MPAKQLELPNIGIVKMYKRRGVKSLRLSVAHDGHVRVTLPTWAPYRVGLDFVRAKQDWILTQKPKTEILLKNGDRIGKAHHLVFIADPHALQIRTRLTGTEIKVMHPIEQSTGDPRLQLAVQTVSLRALRQQAEGLLPQRLAALAQQHGLSYRSVNIKHLKRRWGSCTNDHDIVLNLFLMQLPWHLVDYVLLHELTHTRVLHHGGEFWSAMAGYLPSVKALRQEIKLYQPILKPQ